MDLFSTTARLDKDTIIKLIVQSHYQGWVEVRNDLIEQVKHELNDIELRRIMLMIER